MKIELCDKEELVRIVRSLNRADDSDDVSSVFISSWLCVVPKTVFRISFAAQNYKTELKCFRALMDVLRPNAAYAEGPETINRKEFLDILDRVTTACVYRVSSCENCVIYIGTGTKD